MMQVDNQLHSLVTPLDLLIGGLIIETTVKL